MEIDKKEFEKILKMNQIELKDYLYKELVNSKYNNIINDDGYLYAKGNLSFLLVAHMDRHPNLDEIVLKIDKSIDEQNREKWSSPQGIAGDDRCGVYIILELINKYHPSVLFCEDEEIGCKGSEKFIKTNWVHELEELNFFIQIDRGHGHRNIDGGHNKHGRDVVFYEINNNDFINEICKLTGYGIGKGSCTDIVWLSKETNVASFNISCGYCNEHSSDEYIMLNEMVNCYNAVERVINNIDKKYNAFV